MEADSHLQQRRHRAVDRHSAAGGFGDAGDQLEYRALARTVVSQDAEYLPGLDLHADAIDRVKDSAVSTRPAPQDVLF